MRSDDVVFCGQCGGEMTVGTGTGTGTAGTAGTTSTAVPDPHAGCRAARIYEPPRYCEACGRRMVVQVTPSGWAARCVEHGVVDG